MNRCKHVNKNGNCSIGASSSGDCRLPCSHLEYERCKFEDLNVASLFEYDGEPYMKTSRIYGTPIHSGCATNLKNGIVYIVPNDKEITRINSITIFKGEIL